MKKPVAKKNGKAIQKIKRRCVTAKQLAKDLEAIENEVGKA